MIVRWWYTRRIEQQIQEKEARKTSLAEKLEELKEKSDYYNTQQLLERYDPKSVPKSTSSDKLRDSQQLKQPQHPLHPKPPQDDLRQQNLRQRGIPLPQLPPVVTPSTFAQQLPPPAPQQNIPQFHPSAFSPPPSPTSHAGPESKTFLDRILDLLVGVDENAPEQRYALICRHCRAHNGLAPPGEQPQDVGYLCGRCGRWNGPDLNKDKDKGEESKEKGTGEATAVAPTLPETTEKDVAHDHAGH
jgi:endoplasmic reticulum junction formation protein lunapark